MRFTSRGFPSPQRMGFASGESPSPKRMGFASRGFPYPMRMRVASRGFPPLQCEWDSLQGGPLLQRDSPSPQRQCFASTNPTSSRHQHSSRASSEDNPFERPRLRSSPTIHLPSKGNKEADESSLTAPVKAMIVFILKSFPDAQKSPYHPSSRSFEELQTLRFPRDRFWPSALRCQMPSLTLNKDSLIALRMDGYAILCCLLSTSSRRSPIRLLKEVS